MEATLRVPLPIQIPFLSQVPTNRSGFLLPTSTRRSSKANRFPVLCCTSAAAAPDRFPSDYGGWEDLELLDSPDPLRSFLVSVGIRDEKRAFPFFLGFISALAISRIKFSAMVLFPLSALVFVVGFSSGVSQAERSRDNFRAFDEKLRVLKEFYDEIDAKMAELRNGVGNFVDLDRLEVGEMKNFVEAVQNLGSMVGSAKKSVEGFLEEELGNGYLGFGSEGGKRLNQKPGRKRRDFGEIGYEFVEFLGSIVHENLVSLKPLIAKETTEKEANEKLNYNGESSKVEKYEDSSLGIKGKEGSVEDRVKSVKSLVDVDVPLGSTSTLRSGVKSYDSSDGRYNDDMLSYDEEIDNVDGSFCFTSKQGRSRKVVFQQKHQANHGRNGRVSESALDFFSAESEASSQFEETLEFGGEAYLPAHGHKRRKFQVNQASGVGYKEETMGFDRRSVPRVQVKNDNKEDGYIANDEFNQHVKEASGLLQRARKCMTSQADEEVADTLLYKSASLLSIAVSMKPINLVAVGQLGNTYLLHGELKLKITQELRALLSGGEPLNRDGRGSRLRSWFRKLDIGSLSKENVASFLVDVCEECEALLVKAGRTYRTALSIDRNDVRALYNWGLALSFRAQLIADIGPEAAFDADKVYMAAIDKFDAMMSSSNTLAPEALYMWGLALQRRSHLRPHNSKEKMKLLHQAKSLFEDVLSADSDNERAMEALSSCISEIQYKRKW